MTGSDAKTVMGADQDAWYQFAIKDAATQVLIDNKSIPSECGLLAGKMVEIGAAMQTMETIAGAVNPGLSHHMAEKNQAGPSPYSDGLHAHFAHCKHGLHADTVCMCTFPRCKHCKQRSFPHSRLWSLQPTSPLIFVLNEKDKMPKPVKKDKHKAKKDVKTNKTSDKDKLKVKTDAFGADLDPSAVRSSRSVRVVFHVRPACVSL